MNQTLRGELLVASPYLQDASFAHSVVLMIAHHQQGALGVVLNRPLGHHAGEAWEGALKDEPDFWHALDAGCLTSGRVHLGGPCHGHLLCLHEQEDLSEAEIVPGVHLATQARLIQQITQDPESCFRLFWGYAGWAGGQLEGELEQGGWLTIPASHAMVFCCDVASLWKVALTQGGKSVLRDALNIRHFPEDAQWN